MSIIKSFIKKNLIRKIVIGPRELRLPQGIPSLDISKPYQMKFQVQILGRKLFKFDINLVLGIYWSPTANSVRF